MLYEERVPDSRAEVAALHDIVGALQVRPRRLHAAPLAPTCAPSILTASHALDECPS